MKRLSSHLAVALSYMVFARIFAFLFYGIIFHKTMMTNIELYRPMDAWQWKGLVGLDFLFGLAFSLVFFYLKRSDPFRFAFFYFIITGGFGMTFGYLVYREPGCLLFAGWLTAFSTIMSSAAVLHFLNKKQ